MSYQLKRRPDHTVEVNAAFEAEAVEAERGRILADFRRKARIPGFRPGKAPLSIIRARFGEAVEEELQEHLSKRSWEEVLTGEEDLEPLSPFRVTDAHLDDDGQFVLTAEVEVRPRWDLPAVEKQTLPEISLEVSEADLNEELERLRKEQGVWEPAEGPAEDGMLVEIDIEGEDLDGETEAFKDDGVRFVLGDEGMYPEIQEAVRGAAPGDERVVEKTFVEEDPNPRQAGKKIRYKLSLVSLKRALLPEIDDDFADGLGFESLAALKERAREVLAQKKRNDRRQSWRRALLDGLEEGIDVNTLPESLVQGALREELGNYAYAMAMQGQDPRAEDVDWQKISAQLEPSVRRRVLDELVLEQLADEWEISVPEEEVESFISAEAQRRGIPVAEHRANLAKEDRIEGIRHAARISVTVEEAIRRAGGEVD